jgi:hypothetical protein
VRHARELLKISDSEIINSVAREITEKKIGTREISRKVKEIKGKIENNGHKIPIRGLSPSDHEARKLLLNKDNIEKSGPILFKTSLIAVVLPATVLYIVFLVSPLAALAVAAALASLFLVEKLRIFLE